MKPYPQHASRPGRAGVVALAALCAAAGWLLTPPVVRAVDTPTTAPADAAAIARAVKELAHDQYRVRERATKFLWSVGRAAEPALREALKSKDLEVVSRAEFILEKFKWGLYPDTPKQVVDLIEQYRKGNHAAKRAVIAKILALETHAYRTLSAIAEAETDRNLKADIHRRLRKHVKTAVTELLADAKFTEAEVMLETIAASGHAEGIRHYAAYILQRGRLAEKIAYWTKTSKPAAAEVLTSLHRANGDLAAARRSAEKTRDDALLDHVLFEQGDWKALARRLGARVAEGKTDIETLGFLAAYQRLAGDAKAFEATLKTVGDHAAADTDDLWHCIEVFLVNDRPADALKLAIRHGDHARAADLLVAQWRFAEAIDLIRQSRKELPEDSDKAFELDIALAGHLSMLGEKDQAAKVYDRAFRSLDRRKHPGRINRVVSAEMGAGLTDQAVRHCVEAAGKLDESRRRNLAAAVVPGVTGGTLRWWDFVRKKHPGETFAATLGRVRKLLDRKTGAAGFPALAKEVEKSLADLKSAGAAEWASEAAGWYETLAATADLLGHKGLLLAYRRKAAESPAQPGAWERLGDELLRQEQWADAAKAYEQAAKEGLVILVTYLRGWALARAGQKDEGRKHMDLAALLPLGDEAARFDLAGTMADRGEDAAALAQYRIIVATGDFDSWHLSNATRRLADRRAKARPKAEECFKIADVYEHYRLDCLRTSIGFPAAAGYLAWGSRVHQMRARGHLAAGKPDDAQRQIDQCLALKPGDVDLTIRMAGELDRAGRKARADALFAKVFDLHEKTIRDYPRAALHRNNAAWLGALCRRRLDAALKHATEAVRLRPDYAPNMDTLAEVRFRRGEKAEAIKLVKRCIELDPDRPYYRKQLKRFQSGDRASMPPEY